MRHHLLASCFAALTPLLLVLSACGGGGDSMGSGVCTANVAHDEPALILTTVQNASTSAPLAVVVLSDLVVSGVSLPTELVSTQQSLNIRVVGKTLECTLPCGFSAATGDQSFTVSAPGYAPLKVTAQGSYASSYGTCPVTQTGGHRISLKLDPA